MIRLLLAAGVALALSVVGTHFLIGWLTARGVGQPIREDGPTGHRSKAGTPVMGGIAIVVAATMGWLISDVISSGTFTKRGVIVMAAMIGAAIVGGVDDWLKVSRERNLGLNKRAKIAGLLIVSIGFVVAALTFTNIATTVSLTRYDWPGIGMGGWIWAAWAITLILATANAVNLTDGLDGLAAGSAIFGFAAFVVIGFWGFRHPGVYGDQSFLDQAIIAAAMLGACTGFLWWNAAPARIFMGDTGSLAIGTALACLGLSTNTSLLLVLICGVNVLETVSVILQVGSFRMTGKRIFRMAPLHHHYELGGWPETTVIIRFWILAGLSTALALGIFYADFVRLGVLD